MDGHISHSCSLGRRDFSEPFYGEGNPPFHELATIQGGASITLRLKLFPNFAALSWEIETKEEKSSGLWNTMHPAEKRETLEAPAFWVELRWTLNPHPGSTVEGSKSKRLEVSRSR
jgi:hypothetical protein